MFDTDRERAAVVAVGNVAMPPSVYAPPTFDSFAQWVAGWAFNPGGSGPVGGGGLALWYRRRRRIKRPPHR